MGDFTMPSLGADMEEGTLLEWRVGVGDHVERGDIIAVVDTEKSAVEIEVFEGGVVEELLVEPGTEVAVGTPLARISTGDRTAPEPAPEPEAAPEPSAAPEPEPEAEPEPSAAPEPEVVLPHHSTVLSPLVRRLAAELDVDTDQLVGSGPGHHVTRDDVERAAAARSTRPPTSLPPVTRGGSSPLARRRAAERGVDLATITGSGPDGAIRVRDLDQPVPTPGASTPARSDARDGNDRRASIRQAIARQMTRSNLEIPHYHLERTIEIQHATDWLAEVNQGRSAAERLLPAVLLIGATARAVARHPELNGHWIEGDFRPADGVHLAVAVALRGGGLVVPVIHHADELDLDTTMATLRDLVSRSRRGSLRSSEVSGASLTVTDLGDRGADSVHGVIHPPQVALIGFGRIADRPWAVDGMLGVRSTVVATLAADHRATDGHVGSALLATIDELLAHPDEL